RPLPGRDQLHNPRLGGARPLLPRPDHDLHRPAPAPRPEPRPAPTPPPPARPDATDGRGRVDLPLRRPARRHRKHWLTRRARRPRAMARRLLRSRQRMATHDRRRHHQHRPQPTLLTPPNRRLSRYTTPRDLTTTTGPPRMNPGAHISFCEVPSA